MSKHNLKFKTGKNLTTARVEVPKQVVTVADCNIKLEGTFTKHSKTPGHKSVFGLFPTTGGAKIYQTWLEKTFGNEITFTVESLKVESQSTSNESTWPNGELR